MCEISSLLVSWWYVAWQYFNYRLMYVITFEIYYLILNTYF